MVGQEPVLFSGTIRDNITLGVEGATEADVIEAAKTAHAHQFIVKLANVRSPIAQDERSLNPFIKIYFSIRVSNILRE